MALLNFLIYFETLLGSHHYNHNYQQVLKPKVILYCIYDSIKFYQFEQLTVQINLFHFSIYNCREDMLENRWPLFGKRCVFPLQKEHDCIGRC